MKTELHHPITVKPGDVVKLIYDQDSKIVTLGKVTVPATYTHAEMSQTSESMNIHLTA